MTLPGDGHEYELLTAAARRTTALGLVCEVGTRLGGGIQAIIDGLAQSRVILSIDPYGDINYHHSDGTPNLYQCGYDRKMLAHAMATIPVACHAKGHLWLPLVMDDSQFFQRFADGVPVYDGTAMLATHYALVHLDGPHRTDKVLEETAFFVPRSIIGSAIVYDNYGYFDYKTVAQHLVLGGFELEVMGTEKMVWRKWA